MVDRIGCLLQYECKNVNKIIKRTKSIAILMGIFTVLLLMSSQACAGTVTYYLNATAGVNIGADGVTNVTGDNQNIPPVITALMDITGLNTNDARSNSHPLGIYNHSRWYFKSNYLLQTKINENPVGKAYLRGGSNNDNVTVRLFDYNNLTGSKILIGTSSPIILNHWYENHVYPYTIISPVYIVPRDHRLMLQFEFDQVANSSNARVYASPTNSYLTVIETPLTYNVTINSIPSSASIKAGENFVYYITINNTGNASGNYTLGVSDSDTLNFLPSVPGMTTLFVPAGGSNQTTLNVTAYPGAPKDAVDTVTVTATSIEDPIYSNSTQTTTTVILPITYNVSIGSIPSSASIKAGENFVYSITVNNTGTTNGSYNLGVSDSDTTNFSLSLLGMTTLFVPAGGSNQTTLNVTAYPGAPKEAVDNVTVTATSIEDPVYSNYTKTTTTVTLPITYNVSIGSIPSSASIKAGENFVYSITVNNTGTTNGSYNLGVSDSDTTNFSLSVPGMTSLFVPAGGSNQTTLTVTANGSAIKDAIDTTTLTVTSIENPVYSNFTQTTTKVEAQSFANCTQCHESYQIAINNSKHDQTKNVAAPNCTLCHTGYDTLHTGLIVDENNTCRNCHKQNESGFYERHTSSSDCTACHFANTTKSFSLNTSLYSHDHNLTIEHNFYEYNQSGMPVRTNGGVGVGMFPYYTCTLTCHKYNASTGVEGKIDEAASSWLQSAHASSLHMSGDNKMSCARCKSPANYNVSANQSSLIDQPDWQGVQCRVCHNLHDRKFPNNTGPGGFPIAFYNSTKSSLNGYATYDQVISATQLCENCHSGASHDSKFAGTHKDTAGFNCTNCHMNSSFNNELHKFEVKNTTSSITGCEVCHDPADHTFQGTSLHAGKVECVGCHDQTISRNSTGYAVSPDNNYGIYKDLTTNEWTTYKVSHGAAASWPLHNITRNVTCDKCHGATSVFSGQIAPEIGTGTGCAQCHASYQTALNNSMHNQTKNVAAPNCTLCHTGYDIVHTGLIVDENNTCRNCHKQNESGFYERHTSSSDCTACHFANTTRPFILNSSLYSHDHNLTIEHNFYEYNQSGMPVRTNGGVGVGMFPYYTCTLTCHKYNASTGVEGKIDEAASSWLQSAHAQSLHMSGDNKMSCAKCKSPANYNVSENQSSLIDQPDWQGVQCRVCHNLHDRKFPNNTGPGGLPIAFYNSTKTSLNGYATYEQVTNTTQLCENCHIGTSHDSKFAGTHKDTAGFNCTNCHMNSSFNNELHKFEVKNTTSGITGCEVCHDPADHTFQFTSNHTGKATCEACHDRTVSRNATGYAVSSDGKSYGLYLDPITIEVSSWKDSHGTPATWPLHNISKEVNCNKCHGTYSLYNGSIKQPTLIVEEIQCMRCHNTARGPTNDPTKYPAIELALVTKHKNVNNLTGIDVLDSNDCRTCHYDTTNMSNVLTYSCEDCHFQGSFNASLIKNHIQDGLRITTNSTCSDCHNNSISNYAYSANASVSHYETNTSLIDTSDCIVCHNGIYTNNVSWGNPQNISTSVKRPHNETQTSQCDLCHKDRSIPSLELVTFHNAGLQSDINNCMGCHPTVTSLDMGGHSIFQGTNATENGDCRTCHFESICKLEIGYSNKSNTYYCQDCHTNNATGPNISRIKWEERKHGRAECINCHIADGIYHQGNARGTVANSTYFNRYSTPNINTTDCADCHYAANLDDAPFYAPGGGEHTITPGIGGNGACANSCHKSGNTMSKSMHAVATRSVPYKTTITVPVLNQSTVIKGTKISMTATVDFAYIYAFIDGAQYRIMSGNEIIKPWTPMLAVDGNFNGIHENVITEIETNMTPGTYIVEVRGMAGGPAQNWSILYYPMNGEVSIPQNTTLTILAQMGYINGTVSSGSSNLSEAIVYTTGASDITGSDGKYSLRLQEGIYNVTASKPPKYSDNTITGVVVTPDNTTFVDFGNDLKSTGTITGVVTNI